MQRILNIVAWVGVALVVVAVGLRFAPISPDWSRTGVYLAWAGLLLVLIYPLGMLTRKQARQLAIVSSSVLVVLAVLVAVNYLSNRRFKRWDLTENAIHTLSEQSQKVVSGLDAPLRILVFDRVDRLGGYRDRLAQYENASRRISVEYIDSDLDPLRAREFDIQALPTPVLQYKAERATAVQVLQEQQRSTAAEIEALEAMREQVKASFSGVASAATPAGRDG